MKAFIKVLTVILAILATGGKASAQQGGFDVFIPISKYISQGNSDALAAWFSDNLEISVLSSSNNASKNQARQILKAFFDSYTPRSFKIEHTAGKDNMKYALGNLNAGGENFGVTIFVSSRGEGYHIQQLKIYRLD